MNKINVVVYGSLLAGLHNHRVLARNEAEYLGEVTFKGQMYSLGAYPYVSLHGDTDIRGEMYVVSERCLKELDYLEGHPTYYCREIVETSGGPAWVYLINNDEERSSSNVVRSGDWRAHYSSTELHDETYN